ncbi:MAG: hypothetical protein ABEJ61_07770 [Haloferacaceae archaeon]
MSKRTCEGCGDRVPVGGGVDDLWTFADVSGGGLTLELVDGSEHFLCFDCVERLPDEEVTADDVAALSESL